MEERFFYHSFPRRRQDENEIEKGIKILSSICSSGFLLTPEITKWKYDHSDGSAPRQEELLQKRICFTELSPKELPVHCKTFGHFAIEFDIVALKQMGAIPVFYIPIDMSGKEKGAGVGSILLIQLLDVYNFLFTLNAINELPSKGIVAKKLPLTKNHPQNPALNKTFEIDSEETFKLIEAVNHGLTPLPMLLNSVSSVLNFFYPADNTLHNKLLDYYRQREWKICLNLNLPGYSQMLRQLTDSEKNILLDIDSTFFGKSIFFQHQTLSLLNECLVFNTFIDKHPLEFANRIIVPETALSSAKDLLKKVNININVVSIEELNKSQDL